MINRQVIKPTAWGLGTTLLLSVLILVGSRNLAHFDAALVGYTFSVLFATFGLIALPSGESTQAWMQLDVAHA